MARQLRDRLKFDLARNREELIEVVGPIEDLSYAPAAGMKDYRAQLVEIGAMEAETIAFLSTGQVPAWEDLDARVTGATTGELLESLAGLRAELFALIDGIGDDDLGEAVPVPADWASFVGDTTLEREELFRWLARHEYYHLGQIIAYRWIQGFNPYKRPA